MFLALLTLLISLVISGVAVFYSVSGLAAIFSAAAVPIIIMGASLEIGKLITALWLHRNWKAAPLVLKSYFAIATLVLMFVTSIGIFGFLSRAHIEQTAGIGTVGVQIEQLNLDIRLEQDKIDNNRKIITQLDAAVNNLLQGSATQSQQTRANSAQQASNLATQATRLRQQQNAERTRLQNEITAASNRIADLNRQKLQLDQQIRNIETEVGPIKYIAQFVYGTQARSDKELLEKAVTWLILIIIFVFDPLAVLLLIASQISFHHAMQARREKKLAKEAKKNHVEPQITIPNSENLPPRESKVSAFPVPVNSQITDSVTQSLPLVDNKVSEAAPVVKDPLPRPTTPRKKKEKIIEQSIPDLEVLPVPETKPEPEQPKKKRILHNEEGRPTDQSREETPVAYVQNSEQNQETIWHRVQKIKNIYKPMDILYAAYEQTGFRDLDLSGHDQTDPDMQQLINYINAVKEKQIKLDDIPLELREKLAKVIIGDDTNNNNPA